MRILKMKNYPKNSFPWRFLGGFLLVGAIFALASCAKTVNVYCPPRFDLTQFGRLGMITFSDNAQPSVAEYATEQFQNQIQSDQMGIPIVELGTEEQVLKSIGSNKLDLEAMQKIGQQYKVSDVFIGNLVYSDVKANVNLEDLIQLKASMNTTLNATLSIKLIETEGGATVWSNSTSWKRKLGRVSVSENTGISVGTRGYDDAYKKLIPDMVQDITYDFRGRYVKKRVDE
jgi:hypothetical protein